MNGQSQRNVFFAIFALSGFSGLIYESIWSHYLKLFLGHAAYAQTLVLAIFMGGMAAGSWLCARRSARWGNLLRGYALAEGIIGLAALVFHELFDGVVALAYAEVIPRLGATTAVTAFKWGLAAVIILPQSILLGMTFPLMSAGIIRRFPERPGGTLATLYFANSLGGAIGVLVSGFVLIRLVGLPGTIATAGAINVGLAGIVWWLAGARRDGPAAAPVGARDSFRGEAGLLLAAALLTGLASFVYEIGWIRMLSLVLGSSTHAFELMLSAFIFGLAFGGLWIRRRIDRIARPIAFLGVVQVVMGLLALSTLLLYGSTFNVMQWLLEHLDKTDGGYAQFNLASHAIALAIMLPTTFCAGTTLPLVTVALLRAGHGEGSIGAVYGANTVGAIAGIFLAVHLGLPLVGLKGLITFGGAVDIALGLVLLALVYRRSAPRVPLAAGGLGAAALAATLLWVELDPRKMASGVYRRQGLLEGGTEEVVASRDGKTASVALTGVRDGPLKIRTNGKTDGSVNMDPHGTRQVDEVTMVLSAAVPMLLMPEARTAANIGFGTGLTTHTLLSSGTLAEVDSIEIERAMVELAQAFRPRNELAYSDPRSRIHIEDAKTFFSSRNKRYDIIVSEPSNPWVSGVAGLFSEEFYRLIARHLAEGGLLLQWLQLYEIDIELVVSVLKALDASFDDYAIYAANVGDIVIVAGNGGPIPAPDARLFDVPRFAAELSRVSINGVQDVELRKVGSKRLLAPFLESIATPANSDYYPVLDQYAARARFLDADATGFISHIVEPLPLVEMLASAGPPWRRTDVTSTDHFRGLHPAFAATVYRDVFLNGVAQVPAGREAESARAVAGAAQQLLYRCATAGEGSDKVFLLFEMALRMVSFLRPQELQPIWERLEGLPCGSRLTGLEGQWLALFRAVGDRDAGGMARHAGALLEAADGSSLARRKYLVAAAMLGSLAEGDRETARRLWARYQPAIFPEGDQRMLFRLLVAHSAVRAP